MVRYSQEGYEINTIEIYTDGCALNNGRYHSRGGWAFVVKGGEFEDRSDWCENGPQTNNRYELEAIKEALKRCLRGGGRYDVIIYTDSDYAMKSLNVYMKKWKCNGWRNSKRQPVANAEMLQTIDSMINNMENRREGSVRFIHVRAHNGDVYNEMADRAAKDAAFENQMMN